MLSNTVLRMMIAGGVFYTAGDWFIKKWALGNDIRFLIPGLILWFLGMCLLANEYKYDNMATASLSILIFNMITLVFMSWFCFNEPLNLTKMLGVFFGIISLICMYM